MKPELLVLLGAGATVPAIPGVAQLTETLLADKHVVAPDESGSVLSRDNDEVRDSFFQYIVDRLPAASHSYNFEQLIGITDALAHALREFTSPVTGWAGTPLVASPVSPFLVSATRLNEKSELERALQIGCYTMLGAVSSACDAVQAAPEPHHLSAGLERLAEHFTLRVFSLNYDDLPEHGLLRFATGYERPYDGFVPDKLFNAGARHIHIQLHGSVLFGPDTRGQAILPRYLTREQARSEWRPSPPDLVSADGRLRHNLPMITGFRKTEDLIWEPFGTYHAVFRKAAAEISTVVDHRLWWE